MRAERDEAEMRLKVATYGAVHGSKRDETMVGRMLVGRLGRLNGWGLQ